MRKRRDFSRPEGFRSSRLVVIAAEGRCTESIYFTAVKQELCAANVHIEILHRDSNNSSPESVYAQNSDFMAEYNIEDDDQLWLVIDRDRWSESMLSQTAQKCAQNSHLHFCMSNPCFELWLLLHLEDVPAYSEVEKHRLTQNSKDNGGMTLLKRTMRKLLGSYNESRYDALALLPYYTTAINRAKALDLNPRDRWPQSLGTRVYLLMESILLRER